MTVIRRRLSMSALALHGGPPALQDLGDFPAWPQPDDAGEAALLEVYRSGKWGSTAGPVVADFEQEFAQYQDSTYGTALVNGTLAIVAALRACGVGLGDEVIVPPYTFIATASAALFIGAIPVFADEIGRASCRERVSGRRCVGGVGKEAGVA